MAKTVKVIGGLGDASADDVFVGKTFTSENGVKVAGNANIQPVIDDTTEILANTEQLALDHDEIMAKINALQSELDSQKQIIEVLSSSVVKNKHEGIVTFTPNTIRGNSGTVTLCSVSGKGVLHIGLIYGFSVGMNINITIDGITYPFVSSAAEAIGYISRNSIFGFCMENNIPYIKCERQNNTSEYRLVNVQQSVFIKMDESNKTNYAYNDNNNKDVILLTENGIPFNNSLSIAASNTASGSLKTIVVYSLTN